MNANLEEFYKNGLTWIKSYFWILLVFLLAFLFRFFLIESNPHIQVDEPATFYISAPSVESKSQDFLKKDWDKFSIEKQRNYSGQELNNLLFKPESSIKSMVEDLKLTRLQKMDRQHPSLYYSLVRIWNNYLGDFDKDKYLLHARMLNLIFFCFSFFFMYRLLALIKNDKIFITIALIFAFLNVGSISLSALAREYALQETFFILTTYYTLFLYKKIDIGERISLKTSVLCSLSFALFLVSSYFSVVYYAILFLILFAKSIVKKSKKHINLLVLIILVSAIFTLILCPNYFDFKTNNEHYNSVSSAFSLLAFLSSSVPLVQAFKYLLVNLIYPPVLYFVFFFIFLSRFQMIDMKRDSSDEQKNIITFLLIIVGFWFAIVLFLTPYKCLRFFAAGISVFSLLFSLMTFNFKLYIKTLLAIIFIMFTLVTYTTGTWYDTYDRSVIYQEETTNSLPSVVLNPTYFFLDYAFLSLNENNIVRFEDKNLLKNLPIKGLYKLVCDKNTKPNSKVTPMCILDMRVYLSSNSNN